MNNEPFEA